MRLITSGEQLGRKHLGGDSGLGYTNVANVAEIVVEVEDVELKDHSIGGHQVVEIEDESVELHGGLGPSGGGRGNQYQSSPASCGYLHTTPRRNPIHLGGELVFHACEQTKLVSGSAT